MIAKDMMIGDAIQKYPHAAEVMLSYGLACVGCHVNPHESIEQGARGHGMDDEEIEKMIGEINERMPKEANPNEIIIKLTENAAKQAKKLMAQDNKEGYGLRIGVTPGGCSGFNYLLDFENEEKEGDIIQEQHGVKLFINKEDAKHIQGMELDYLETLQQQGFKFNNPNAVQTCGCGTSFTT